VGDGADPGEVTHLPQRVGRRLRHTSFVVGAPPSRRRRGRSCRRTSSRAPAGVDLAQELARAVVRVHRRDDVVAGVSDWKTAQVAPRPTRTPPPAPPSTRDQARLERARLGRCCASRCARAGTSRRARARTCDGWMAASRRRCRITSAPACTATSRSHAPSRCGMVPRRPGAHAAAGPRLGAAMHARSTPSTRAVREPMVTINTDMAAAWRCRRVVHRSTAPPPAPSPAPPRNTARQRHHRVRKKYMLIRRSRAAIGTVTRQKVR